MSRERIDIRPGDSIRCPDRPTSRWHRVLRIGRRKNGTRYVVIRRSSVWRGVFGFSPEVHLEWSVLRAVGYGIRRSVPGTTPYIQKIEPERPWSPPPPPAEAPS